MASAWVLSSLIQFLLAPLREGRLLLFSASSSALNTFLLAPLREGRHGADGSVEPCAAYFYSRPCVRGDRQADTGHAALLHISTRAPA